MATALSTSTPFEIKIKNKSGKSQVWVHFDIIKEDGQIDKKTRRVQIMPNYSQVQQKYHQFNRPHRKEAPHIHSHWATK